MLSNKNHLFTELLTSLRPLVIEKFSNNPSIVYIKSSEHIIKDPYGIDFNVKILESLNHKPEGQKDQFTGEKKKENPFLPPFEEG